MLSTCLLTVSPAEPSAASDVNVLNLNAGNLVAGTVDSARLRLEGNVYIIVSPPSDSLGINGNTAVSVIIR